MSSTSRAPRSIHRIHIHDHRPAIAEVSAASNPLTLVIRWSSRYTRRSRPESICTEFREVSEALKQRRPI